MPLPTLLAYLVGIILVLTGIGLFVRPTIRIAAATSGIMLLLLTAIFYVPILALEIHTALAVEGINYVADTLLFAATALLAGFARRAEAVRWPPDSSRLVLQCGVASN